MRTLIQSVVWSWVFIILGLPVSGAESRQPNIVLIVADDLGYGELGCYGQQWIKTPNIDQLAADGMRFTQFYSGSPVCAPSRCTLMTGKHTGHAATRNNGAPKHLEHLREKFGWEFKGQNPMPPEEVLLSEILKQRGYATAAIGKWGLGHFGTTGDPTVRGIDLFYGFNSQSHAHNHYPKFLWRNRTKVRFPGNDRTLSGETFSQDKFAEVALQFIKDHQKQPFFLYLPFAIPHLGIQVPQSSLAQYEDKIPEQNDESRYGKHYVRHPKPRAGYAAMVSHMDRDIGNIMQLVDQLGLAEDTIFLFSSDNGPTYNRLGGSDSDFFNSSGPLRGRKGSVLEGGIRVPLIVKWPDKIQAGSTTNHQAAFWDILPTVCEILNEQPPSEIDGISIAPTLMNEGEQLQHDYLYWEFPAYGGQQAVRVGDWKAIRSEINQGNMKLQLYNLAEDLGEKNDLASKHPDRVAEMERIMVEAHIPSERFPLFASEKQK